MRASSMHTSLRWLAVAAVLALFATACGTEEETDDAAAAQAQAAAAQAEASAAQADADAAEAALAQAQADLEAAQAAAAEAMEGDDAAQAELAAALAEAEAALDEAEMAAEEAMKAAEAAEAAAAEEAAATTMPEEEEMAEAAPFTYKLAIFSDPTTDNPWAYFDTEADVWNQYVLSTALPSLYGSTFPSYTVIPSIAADVEPPLGAASGDNWVIDVNLRQGLVWSDGSPITANDVAFTFNAVKDLEMGGNWFSALPMARDDDPDTEENEGAEGLISVEAVDDHTVRYTWSSQPGLAQWQFGAAQSPIFSEAHWGPHVAASGDAGELYAVSGEGAPSGGSMVFDRREPGAFARSVANANANDRGAQTIAYSSGGVTFAGDVSWQVGDTSGEVIADSIGGPYVSDAIYSVYDTQDAAVLALRDGEVDFLLNPLGLQRGLQSTVLEAGDLDVIANSSNGFRYLAFNTRSFPGSDVAFRQAMACMIDKEFMATNVLQGVAIPLNSMVPPGNAFWANPELDAWCGGQSQEERLNSAVQILKDAGWTWDVEPQWNSDNRDVIPKGEGLRGPDGTPVGDLELLAPGPGYDPLRATYSLFIADWANDLGIPLTAEPTGFSVIVDRVFGPVDWDMYILGWGLTIFPDYVADFFDSRADSATGGGFNIPGYANPAFDEMADQLKAETDINEAAAIVRRMDAVLAQDVPYVILFTTPVLEAFRNTLEFPSTTTLDGLQNFQALPGAVNLAQ
ncbi:ABC transporter substrate-binding protein [Candidatus Spongiisocius sp.]|uniref:ABC transporter substrate-binding protein n=1 Tax=Candidatus Spongiisocius sp. TaxID=3101273 RepID=UPI003B58DA40